MVLDRCLLADCKSCNSVMNMNHLFVDHRIGPFFLLPKDKMFTLLGQSVLLILRLSKARQQSVMVQVLPLKTEWGCGGATVSFLRQAHMPYDPHHKQSSTRVKHFPFSLILFQWNHLHSFLIQLLSYCPFHLISDCARWSVWQPPLPICKPRKPMITTTTITSKITNATQRVYREQCQEVISYLANAMWVHVREAWIGREYVQWLTTVKFRRAKTCHAT